MNVPLISLLLVLLLSIAPGLVESKGRRTTSETASTTNGRRQNNLALDFSESGGRNAPVTRRSLQNDKQDKNEEDDDDQKDWGTKNVVPAASPLTFAPAPSPILSAAPSTLTPVIPFGSTWDTAPVAAPADAGSVPDNGDTESWAFTLTLNPPLDGNLLVVPLQDYLGDATVEFANGRFQITSPQTKVVEHQDAVRNVVALQSHLQQTLGDPVVIESTNIIVMEDVTDSSIKAGASPTTTTNEQFSTRDIVLLVFFGVSMTVIVSGIAALFLWKKPEIGENQKGQSQEWTYDKDKEDRLVAVDTLSPTTDQEEEQ